MSISDIGIWVAIALTVMVYTYLIGDNVLYRAAVYIFAGLTAGFVAIVTYDSALHPWISAVGDDGGVAAVLIGVLPFLIALALLPPALGGIFNRLFRLRSLALAFLIGVGAAVSVVGAISGTIIPITLSTGQGLSKNILVGSINIIGVITTLVYFQYLAQRQPDGQPKQNSVIRALRAIGGIFIAITLGTVYSAAIATTLTVFSERMGFLVTEISQIILQFFGG